MSTKKSDDKAVVSFSSDSDEDESSSSSSSSRLSSSESSEEESGAETVTFVVPPPPSSQVSAQAGAGKGVGGGEPAAKEESNARAETNDRNTGKVVRPESSKSSVAESKEKSVLKKTEIYEEAAAKKEPIKTKDKPTSDSTKELRKSPGKQQETADELKVTKRGANSVTSERAKSPKITVNNFEEDPPKQTKKSSADDVTLTSNKTTRKSPADDGTVTSNKTANNNRAGSPKKTANDEEAEKEPALLSTRSSKEGKQAASPRKEDAEENVVEVEKTTKRSSKLSAERAKSPKNTSAELVSVPETKSIDRAKSPKKTTGDKDIQRAKSPKKTSEDIGIERAKSPKKTVEDKDAEPAKSLKKTLEATDAERAKSPRKTLEEKDAEREKSPRTSSNKAGEAKKKSFKDSSKTPYELLRTVDSPEKSPTRTIKSKNSSTIEDESSTTTSSGKSPQKDLEGNKVRNQEISAATDPAKSKKTSKKTAKIILSEENGVDAAAEQINTKDEPEKVTDLADRPRKNQCTKAEDFPKEKDLSKAEAGKMDAGSTPAVKSVTTEKSAKVKDKLISAEDETQKTGVFEAKVTDSSDPANEVELLLKEIRQKRLSQMSVQPELETDTLESGIKSIRVTVDDLGKTDDASKTPNNAKRDAEVTDKDYMKVTGSSRTAAADDGTGRKQDLENEESEFTYRRKSMDEFIKRILAEAREERLKQKQGGSSKESTEDDRKPEIGGYAERNGDLTENGLDRSKWNSSGEKDGSMLDRRLAIIEKRRFGGSSSDAEKGSGGGGVEGSRSKVGKETEEDGTTNRTTKSSKDATDCDVNLDEDLEEINRFLQSRKSAASRFDFDEPVLNDDDATSTTTMKRRLATSKEQQQQQQPEAEDLPSSGPRSQVKKYGMDLEFDDDDERFLGRFKRERDSALPEDSFAPRRRDDTGEVVRERTRNVRVLVDQQVEIVHAMRNTSKSLDELEKEIREVRQVCLDRQARIEALEGELGAEYRAFANDQMAASDRQQQKSTDGLLMDREDLAATPLGRLRRQDKFKSESLDEDNFPFRRRSGSVASTTSYTSGFDGRGRLGDGSNDGTDFRPPSGLKQSRRTSENEPDLSSSGVDRRRGGSVTRDRNSDVSSFGPDDITSVLLSQRSARSRASIATSNPTVDYADSISGDSFLAKIRAKYSFLAPSLDTQSYSSSIRGQGIRSSGLTGSYANSSSATPDSRYGKRYGSRDILSSSSSAYSSLGTGVGGYSNAGRYSIRDTRSPSYGTGGFITSGSGGGGSSSASISSSYGDSIRTRRAQSVSEISFDRPTTSPTNLGSYGGEFHSRFLDKVRGKKAMGDEPGPAAKDQEKPFKSRFLKTTSFDAGFSSSARADRLTNGFEDKSDASAGEHARSSSGVNGNA